MWDKGKDLSNPVWAKRRLQPERGQEAFPVRGPCASASRSCGARLTESASLGIRTDETKANCNTRRISVERGKQGVHVDDAVAPPAIPSAVIVLRLITKDGGNLAGTEGLPRLRRF